MSWVLCDIQYMSTQSFLSEFWFLQHICPCKVCIRDYKPVLLAVWADYAGFTIIGVMTASLLWWMQQDSFSWCLEPLQSTVCVWQVCLVHQCGCCAMSSCCTVASTQSCGSWPVPSQVGPNLKKGDMKLGVLGLLSCYLRFFCAVVTGLVINEEKKFISHSTGG
jgi:hypothetical protein